MLGLTTLGIVHTAISLVAVFCGFYALFRDKEISLKNRLGQTYVVTTLLTALTGFGIFQHGGFGPPHVLGVLTVLALAVGTVAATTALFGRASRYVQAISFTTTLLLFHMIPGFTESLTRLPPGAPLAASPEAPLLKGILAVLLVVLLIALVLQLRWVRASSAR
jgi:uncharacterized membrane protein